MLEALLLLQCCLKLLSNVRWAVKSLGSCRIDSTETQFMHLECSDRDAIMQYTYNSCEYQMITNERKFSPFLLKQQSFVDVLDFSESFISGYVGYIVFVF